MAGTRKTTTKGAPTKRATNPNRAPSTKDTLEEHSNAISAINDKVENLNENIESIARSFDIFVRQFQNAQEVGDPEKTELGNVTAQATNDGHAQLIKPNDDISEIEIQNVINPDKEALLAFYREPVTIEIAASNNPDEQSVIEVSVNGRSYLFIRGQERRVPRYVVETLAMARPIGYRNEEYTRNDGVKDVKWPKTQSLRYPFTVIEDNNPKGRHWLQGVMQRAA